jgi:carbamoyltransferase
LYLGLNISHDSSVALTDSKGNVISALAEERVSRRKNHLGIPRKALELVLSGSNYVDIEKIIIGSNSTLNWSYALRMVQDLEGNPSNPEGSWLPPAPGASYKYRDLHRNLNANTRELVEFSIKGLLPNEIKSIPVIWEKHHDSHLGCALGCISGTDSLLFSFDGEGDGESGAIGIKLGESKKVQTLHRIDRLDSLGLLYSAVTRRYNFIGGKHEGKITGLAAYGSNSAAIDILLSHIKVKNGKVNLIRAKTLKSKITSLALSQLGFSRKEFRTLAQIIDVAESKTMNYADLAFAVQYCLEKSMLEIISFWVDRYSVRNISLAGGVFSNVKLNQKISEMEIVNDVKVFPNMGDGGIALGGIWSYLDRNNSLGKNPLYSSMYLAPETIETDDLEILDVKKDNSFMLTELSSEQLVILAANDIAKGKICALHNGRMEFGPRALGNRSLLLDPRDRDIVQTVNQKLKRTEFMPFAPVILLKHFHDYFEVSPTQSLQPFYYMTMTCKVKQSVQHKIQAVVHKDFTARPQIVDSNSNLILNNILEEFNKITGIPMVVNTSLNVHEEPINFKLIESIQLIKDGTIDVLYTKRYRITLNNV